MSAGERQWFGYVPEGWVIKRLASYFSERKVKVSDKDFPPLSVTKNGILPQLENVAKTDDGDNRKLVRKGDFVINSRSDRKGSSGVSEYDGSVSLINLVLQPRGGLFGAYCNYLLKSLSFVEENYRNGRGIVADLWTTRYDEMKMIKVAMPPLPEQKEIVAYLDAEAGRIDKAIAAEEKMIALLQERREIVINEAVGGGMDFNAETQRRRGWEVKRFKNLFSTCTGISFTKAELVEEGSPVLSYGQIHSKDNSRVGVNKKLIRHIPAALTTEKSLAYKGDFLFADTSEDLESCGNCICVDTDEPIYAGSHVILARKQHGQIGRFLAYEFASVSWRKQLRKLVNGVKVYSITQTILNSVPVWLPSIPEQEEIVKRLDAETGKIDRAIEVKRRQIELLREWRQIVIDEAVTGKVKVA